MERKTIVLGDSEKTTNEVIVLNFIGWTVMDKLMVFLKALIDNQTYEISNLQLVHVLSVLDYTRP